MSRTREPQQFILDEVSSLSPSSSSLLRSTPTSLSLFLQETADEDDTRSQTSSLLLDHNNSHSYPPEPPTETENEKSLPNDIPPHSHSITIPTRQAVNQARLHPQPRKRHTRLILIGLFGLFGFAYVSTQLLALGTRFGGTPKVQVILMISDGMGTFFYLSLEKTGGEMS